MDMLLRVKLNGIQYYLYNVIPMTNITSIHSWRLSGKPRAVQFSYLLASLKHLAKQTTSMRRSIEIHHQQKKLPLYSLVDQG